MSDEARASMSEAGKRRAPPSAETRAKLAAARIGWKHSEETRAKISASNTGQKRSAETCARISAAKKGYKYGPMSDEQKAKLSAAKGTPCMADHRRFVSLSAAGREIGCAPLTIRRRIENGAPGYRWAEDAA